MKSCLSVFPARRKVCAALFAAALGASVSFVPLWAEAQIGRAHV